MEIAKKAKDYTIFKKRSGRFGVKDAKGNWIKGEPKVNILVKEGMIKVSAKKAAAAPEADATEEVEQ